MWNRHLWVLLVCASCGPKPIQPGQEMRADASIDVDSGAPAPLDEDAAAPTPGVTELPDPGLDAPCNGRGAYCSLRYDETSFLATHDSAANSAEFWQHPAQDTSIRDQFGRGVRALSLSVFDQAGVSTVCRDDCAEGNTPLNVVLDQVALFLSDNPREVVTLLIDSEVSASRLEDELVTSGLDAAALEQDLAAPWPTLGEMIDSETRLVVIADAPDSETGWLLPREELVWETETSWPSLIAMSCNPDGGDSSRPFYVVHHDLVEPIDAGVGGVPSPELAAEANEFSIVTARLQACEQQFGRIPNFVAVDFASVGDADGATQVLNGVRTP